ncbi:ROK family protein [Spiroplasma taiwanense]|uniref:Glucokinase n=1 Tax=Spiroplasma taiwanense CT-1 TaxID=1276220 RepID=S5MCB8_9MOLU|nr:ROK family protein [Spiroplasma taiwanense]AGR41383.1 glucokinase [Spiroplasma taiwanense CT-1]
MDFDFIGLACPGPLNLKTGEIINTPNLPAWNGKNLVEEFKKIFLNKEIKFNNNANVAALGQFSIRKVIESLLYFTVSTRIGAGFINEGKIFNGFTGKACEIANALPKISTIEPSKSGFEYLASGKNIAKRLQELGVKVENAKEAFEIFKTRKNSIVSDYFITMEIELISLFSTAIYFLNPEIIVIGGSVAMNNQDWFNAIFNKVLEVTSDISYKTKFEFAKELDDSTLIGCCEL